MAMGIEDVGRNSIIAGWLLLQRANELGDLLVCIL